MWKEVIQKFKGEPLVFPEPRKILESFDGVNTDAIEFSNEGQRPFYFYLHGRAEELNGFDICNFNDVAMAHSLSNFATLCYIVWYDGTVAEGCAVERGIILKNFNGRRMEGFVCLLSDHIAIRYCVDQVYGDSPVEMYSLSEKYLKDEHRYVHSILFKNYYETNLNLIQ